MIFKFGSFQLDTSKFLLTDNNEKIEIEPQVFDLIVFLIENRKRLVTRDEIFEKLWHGREVLDASLSNHVKIARSLLKDDGQAQLVIRTIRGRGYQFVATVEAAQNNNALGNKDKFQVATFFRSIKYILTISILLFALLFTLFKSYNPFNQEMVNNVTAFETKFDLKSIAILPFENRSNRESDLFFTDGIHDDLLTRISKIVQLKTISRTSVMAYRNTKKNVKLIAKELGVTSILEGGVQRAGNEIRINVQLINAQTDAHIWAESYTRELTANNVFIIQTEISNEIAKQLKIELVPKDEQTPTLNMAALEAFFHAQFSSDLDNNTNYEQSIKYLESAIKHDSDFSLAYVELANIHLDRTYRVGLNVKEQIEKSRPLLEKAIAINPNLSRAYRVYAKLNMYDQDPKSAKANYQKAIETNPSDSDAQAAFGWNEFRNGRIKSAIKHLRIAKALNPTDDKLTSSFSRLLIRAGQFEEPRKYLNEILARRKNFADAYRHLSDIQLFSEREIAESMQTLHKGIMIDPKYIPSLKNMAARYVYVGYYEGARKWYQLVIDHSPNSIDAAHAKMLMSFINQDYDKAYDILAEMSKENTGYLYHFANNAIRANRFNEAMKLFKERDPTLFSKTPDVNEGNFTRAYIVAKWFNTVGKQKQAKWILEQCLKIALIETSGQINGKQNNWLARIYLELGDKKSALTAFDKIVNEGFFNIDMVNSTEYHQLLNESKYLNLIKVVKQRIEKEVIKIKNLEAKEKLNLPIYEI